MPRLKTVKKDPSNRRKKSDKADQGLILSLQFLFVLIFVIILGLNSLRRSSISFSADIVAPQTPDLVAISMEAPEPEPSSQFLRLIGNPLDHLNVRSGPGTNYKLLSQIPDEGSYEYTTIEDSWYRIIMKDGAPGWIYGDYAEVIH